MRKRKSMCQMKEQATPEKNLNEMDISSLPDKKFKVMILKMLTKLGRRMDEQSENFNKEKMEGNIKQKSQKEYNC